MASDYFLLVFIASIGVYQMVSVHAGLRGLSFFRQPKVQYVFGLLVIIGAFVWFFVSEDRNYQHAVEGTQQLGLFLAAIVAAYVANAALSSIIQLRATLRGDDPGKRKQHEQGMETLKKTTVLGGVASSIRRTREEKR